MTESSGFATAMVMSLVMGIVLNYTMFLCTIVNSALTTTIVGVLKGVVTTVSAVSPAQRKGSSTFRTYCNFSVLSVLSEHRGASVQNTVEGSRAVQACCTRLHSVLMDTPQCLQRDTAGHHLLLLVLLVIPWLSLEMPGIFPWVGALCGSRWGSSSWGA